MKSNCIRFGKSGLTLVLISLASFAASSAEEEQSVDLLPSGQGHYFWAQVQAGASVFDTRRDIPSVRGSVGVQLGRRMGRFGLFLNSEFDQGLKSESNGNQYPAVSTFQFGPGFEYINAKGTLRSSISGGLSVLTDAAGGERAGKRGWYLDLRPVSVRWANGKSGAWEFSPFAIDINVPSDRDDLKLVGHYFNISYEWSGF